MSGLIYQRVCLSSGMSETEKITLFLDVGTNGEMVLGSKEWLVTCACSAGPAFEGAGVLHGMRATTGAIDEVWINEETKEASWRVIGGGETQRIMRKRFDLPAGGIVDDRSDQQKRPI